VTATEPAKDDPRDRHQRDDDTEDKHRRNAAAATAATRTAQR
jgi:hypothetical protein